MIPNPNKTPRIMPAMANKPSNPNNAIGHDRYYYTFLEGGTYERV